MEELLNMKNFTDALVDLIIENETPRLNNIMQEVSKKIQDDFVDVTYGLIDAYYQDYTFADGRVYIRTDEYKASHSHPKNKKTGKFKKKNKAEWTRAGDKSLMSAIKSMNGDEPAIGVCRELDGVFGWQAGVVFDESYFNSNMKHSIKGSNFTEWDVAENFLWGAHGNDDVYVTAPPANMILDSYLYSYKSRFDKHYNDACKKFKR